MLSIAHWQTFDAEDLALEVEDSPVPGIDFQFQMDDVLASHGRRRGSPTAGSARPSAAGSGSSRSPRAGSINERK